MNNLTATPINAWSPLINGVTNPPTNSVTYTAIFSEPVDGTKVLASEFQFDSNGLSSTGLVVTPIDATHYDVAANGIVGAGVVVVEYRGTSFGAGNVPDLAGNVLTAFYFQGIALGGTGFNMVALPQPSGNVASLGTTAATSSTLTVSWTDVVAVQAPTHYLVMLKKTTTPSFDVVADGGYLADDTDLTDGDLKLNISQGVGSATFNGLAWACRIILRRAEVNIFGPPRWCGRCSTAPRR